MSETNPAPASTPETTSDPNASVDRRTLAKAGVGLLAALVLIYLF